MKLLVNNKKRKKNEKGMIIIIVLVFSFIFLILLSAVLNFILLQSKMAKEKIAWNESFDIAEAGINYYRWCLNHQLGSSCQTTKTYLDSDGKEVGQFSLEITPITGCGDNDSQKIISTGWTDEFPDIKRKISVLYAKTSVAKYAYLLNSNVWAGSDREIRGLYHSNGGVRMDGTNESLVTSSQDKWVCTDSFGCNPCPTDNGCWIENSTCYCPGVFTTTENPNESLFKFPVTSFDFNGITIDLTKIKDKAEAVSTYLPPSEDINRQGKGYHLIFKDDGQVDVWIITSLYSDWAYNLEEGWHYDYFRIRNEYFYKTISFPSSCRVIYAEDNIWLEGIVKGKITVASANLIETNKETNIILPGNIKYADTDGSDGLTLISQKDILISPSSPDDMELDGIFIAQNGHFGRNLYWWNTRDNLKMVGAIVSNGRVGTQWTSGSYVVSGYLNRENYVDPGLIYEPPPFTPAVEYEYNILKWQEVK